MSTVPLIFELSQEGKRAIRFPKSDVPEMPIDSLIPADLLRTKAPGLPEVSEIEAVRHFTQLSRRNHGVDVDFYPLGSCTMKYNPKVNEDVARIPGIGFAHPLQPAETVQGNLKLLHTMEEWLCEVTGMDRMTFQPAAGAHGELTGILLIKAYHESRGDLARNKVIVPDSAHGTNPATAAMAGFEVISVKSNPDGSVDLGALKAVVGPDTAALMMTNPSTLGLFDPNINEVAAIIHKAGGLVYYDGANMNAIMGYARPGDMGFDVVHLNLHKTFSTPHGGGGPGSGPVGVKDILVPFLPVPVVEKQGEQYEWDWNRPQSIGKIHGHYGNFGVVARAFAYTLAYGPELKEVSEYAVLNANYIMAHLRKYYDLAADRYCMHECVLSAKTLKSEVGVKTLDIAKRLLDEGVHPPTIYFPLIVEEAIMIEPTETEDKATLDRFIDAMVRIYQEAKEDPEKVKSAPHTTVVGRLDEALAARKPNLRYRAD
ncbi:MAG TPA: aminomethyl-transferring glycine dehydrogenase subunit GcvPB [Symbiobacteriaceae bacterium]|nr:aminomethyl-transferring glycine dehydrogenase subunit GcvPB [Symbiobacteriaceae bacterium]